MGAGFRIKNLILVRTRTHARTHARMEGVDWISSTERMIAATSADPNFAEYLGKAFLVWRPRSPRQDDRWGQAFPCPPRSYPDRVPLAFFRDGALWWQPAERLPCEWSPAGSITHVMHLALSDTGLVDGLSVGIAAGIFANACSRVRGSRLYRNPAFATVSGAGRCVPTDPSYAGYCVVMGNVASQIHERADRDVRIAVVEAYFAAFREDGLVTMTAAMGDDVPRASKAFRTAIEALGLDGGYEGFAARVDAAVLATPVYVLRYADPPDGWAFPDLALRVGGPALFDVAMMAISAVLNARAAGLVIEEGAVAGLGWRRIGVLELDKDRRPIAFTGCAAVRAFGSTLYAGKSALVPHHGVVPTVWRWDRVRFAGPDEEGGGHDYAWAVYRLLAIARLADGPRMAQFAMGWAIADMVGLEQADALHPLGSARDLWTHRASGAGQAEDHAKIASAYMSGLLSAGYDMKTDDELASGAGRFMDMRDG